MSIVIVALRRCAAAGPRLAAAQARGVPVNVVDTPALSSFIMPAIVDRGPITIAISTGGAAPALARKLRAEIERALPAAIGRLARFAEIFRAQVRRTLAEPRARRLFWDRVFEGRVGELALAGDEIAARRELIRLLDSARRDAGPGAGHGPSGRRRSRRSRPPDAEGASPAAGADVDRLRPAGLARSAGRRPPRCRAHVSASGAPARVPRDQRLRGARPRRPERGAPGRATRPFPKSRRSGSPALPSRSCPACPPARCTSVKSSG